MYHKQQTNLFLKSARSWNGGRRSKLSILQTNDKKQCPELIGKLLLNKGDDCCLYAKCSNKRAQIRKSTNVCQRQTVNFSWKLVLHEVATDTAGKALYNIRTN